MAGFSEEHWRRYDEMSPDEVGKLLTVEEWVDLTQGWDKAMAFIAKSAMGKSESERKSFAEGVNTDLLFGLVNGTEAVRESLAMAADIWALPNDALQRLNTALAQNERAGLLSGPADKKVYPDG